MVNDNDINLEAIESNIKNGEMKNDINFDDGNDKNMETKANEINLNKKYKGKTLFTISNLIELLKNPLKYQQKNIENKNLFDMIYKNINDFKIDIGYKNNEKQIIELENKSNILNSEIKELSLQIEKNFEKNKIDINQFNDEKIINKNLNGEINIYLGLKKLFNEIENKLKFYEDNKLKILKLNESISDKEKEVNNYIDIIKVHIEKSAKLINIKDIFNEYKLELQKNIEYKPQYKEHSDIFSKENIDNFKIGDLYQFLKTYLKEHNFSITKRDITNFNLLVEILNEFSELYYIYENNIDVKFLPKFNRIK